MDTDNDQRLVDLQIVGAGLAGLLATNLALDAGLSVRLIERAATPGGRATSASHHGYTLNVGPHALYVQGELRRVLRALGHRPAGVPPLTKGGTGSIGDRIGLLPVGPGSLMRTSLLTARAKIETAKLQARIPRLDPEGLASITVESWIGRHLATAEARALMYGIVNLTTYNAAADRASVDAVVAQLKLALDRGVHYLEGGWGTMVEWLRGRADRRGVERVEATARLVSTGPSTTVITTTDARLTARSCLIAAGGPAGADRLLGLDGHHARAAGPAVDASVLDLGLRRRPPVGAHLGLDQGLYATLHSVAGGLAPTGRHLVSLARYRRPDDTMDPDDTRKLLFTHAEGMGIDPADVEMDRYLHRLTVAGGMPLAERGGLAGRPAVAVADRPGVFVAGDWVGPRGLLADAAAASAGDAIDAVVTLLAGPRPHTGVAGRGRLVES